MLPTLFAALFLGVVSTGYAQTDANAGLTFTTFTVPGATSLSVASINDPGMVSGSYIDSSGATISFLRAVDGTITTYTEPNDTSTPLFTAGGQINRTGVVAGEYFDTANSIYEGFIYRSSAGTFSSFQVPGQPSGTTTGLFAINDKGNLCGYVIPPPYTTTTAFVDISGTVSLFSVNGSLTTVCLAINDSGTAVGYYTDTAGVFHGWMRTSAGVTTILDLPDAASTPGTAPCVTGPVAGTVSFGINNMGYVSGHYWDTSYNEHGFIRTPGGKWIRVNAPGAYQTAGGGLNDKVSFTGHYVDSVCNQFGFIAKP